MKVREGKTDKTCKNERRVGGSVSLEVCVTGGSQDVDRKKRRSRGAPVVKYPHSQRLVRNPVFGLTVTSLQS